MSSRPAAAPSAALVGVALRPLLVLDEAEEPHKVHKRDECVRPGVLPTADGVHRAVTSELGGDRVGIEIELTEGPVQAVQHEHPAGIIHV